ncbi:bifunctional UDP-N-acetylglucosamine diphosphorylase/glucosamine-1-phosphate N-acetyltransferase GlmU [SAR86 cluster bacterium]|nr:bifunctional UDP-N-acetylglucosamine diphosphorylase/glucosamine-1-phosphate N-acetyltransferase GlmU [SAR86 cluster bacterium]
MNIDFIILAAGKGTRMGGDSPKVLASLAGKPMIQHLIDTVDSFPSSKTSIVVGYKSNEVERDLVSKKKLCFVKQNNQLGTAHAVKKALPNIRKNSVAVVLYGDVPLVKKNTLNRLIKSASTGKLSLLTFTKEDPTGYGRIIRSSKKNVEKIIEHKDASSAEKEIREVNSGILAIKARLLQQFISKIKNNNAAKEYYLTDLVEIANNHSVDVVATLCDPYEVGGANDKKELHELERACQKKLAEDLLKSGVTIADTSRIDIRGDIKIGQNSFVDVNNVFVGNNVFGKNVHIGPNCYISNSSIKDNTIIYANTVLEDSLVGKNCKIGPFARIRGGSELTEGAELGNFVEANRSNIGKNSKAKHLTYLGDARLGTEVNVGAGTITCNYDGKNKHKTIIADGTFIGSNSSLVAPLVLGENSYTGAGSVITKDVPKGKLAVARGKQVNLNRKK